MKLWQVQLRIVSTSVKLHSVFTHAFMTGTKIGHILKRYQFVQKKN